MTSPGSYFWIIEMALEMDTCIEHQQSWNDLLRKERINDGYNECTVLPRLEHLPRLVRPPNGTNKNSALC